MRTLLSSVALCRVPLPLHLSVGGRRTAARRVQAVSVRVLIHTHDISTNYEMVHCTHARSPIHSANIPTHKHVRENALLLSRRPYPETRPASASVRARADRMQCMMEEDGGQHCISGEVAHDTSCRLADAIREAQTHWGRLPHSSGIREPRRTKVVRGEGSLYGGRRQGSGQCPQRRGAWARRP